MSKLLGKKFPVQDDPVKRYKDEPPFELKSLEKFKTQPRESGLSKTKVHFEGTPIKEMFSKFKKIIRRK